MGKFLGLKLGPLRWRFFEALNSFSKKISFLDPRRVVEGGKGEVEIQFSVKFQEVHQNVCYIFFSNNSKGIPVRGKVF